MELNVSCMPTPLSPLVSRVSLCRMVSQCKNDVCFTSPIRKLQDVLTAYADRLAATTAAVDYVNMYRNQRPQQFIDLCKFHLSLLVELPVDFNDYNLRVCTEEGFTDDAMSKHKKKRSWTRVASSVGQGHMPDQSPHGLTESMRFQKSNAVYENVIKLMDHLSAEENLKMEMIFRKSGNIFRQRELRRCILSGAKVSFPVNFVDTGVYARLDSSSLSAFPWSRKPRRSSATVQARLSEAKPGLSDALKGHDYANTLKSVLREMRDPILTRDLLPIFVSISKITSGNVNDEGVQVALSEADFQVAQAKQLMAIRILRFLLPERNQRLLRRLLDLLTETLGHSQFNGMSAESLGTIFGPILLAPNCYPNTDLHKQYDTLNSFTTLLIEQGSEGVFGIPVTLVDDIYRNLALDGLLSDRFSSKDSGLDTSSTASSGREETTGDALYTGLAFSKKSIKNLDGIKSDPYDVGPTITEYAVAELCATVQALPDSDPRKARLVQRINNSNGGLTPQIRRPLKESPLLPPFVHRKSFQHLETPSNVIFSGALAKHPVSGSPEVEAGVCAGGESPTAHSPLSLNVGSVGSLCCPPFTVRSVNLQTKPARQKQNLCKRLKTVKSPVFGDMGASVSKGVYLSSGIKAAGRTSNTGALMATCKHTCLQRMRVRRNYHRDRIKRPYMASKFSCETPHDLRKSA